MLNQLVLIGRISSDLEIKDDKLKMTVTTPRIIKNDEGIYESDTFPITIYEGIAKNTAEYCHKGDLIGIKGRVQANSEQIEIIVEKLTLLSNKKDEENENN